MCVLGGLAVGEDCWNKPGIKKDADAALKEKRKKSKAANAKKFI